MRSMADYGFPTTELGMVRDARTYLLANGGTPDELTENQRLIDLYSRTRSMPIVLDPQRQRGTGNPTPYDSTVSEAVLGAPDDDARSTFDDPPMVRTVPGAKSQQIGLVHVLMRKLHDHNRSVWDTLVPLVTDGIELPENGGWDIPSCSAFITLLRSHLAAEAVTPPVEEAKPQRTYVKVDDGRYALRNVDDPTVIKFYHVKTSKRTGNSYVLVQHSDDTSLLRWDQGAATVLERIAENPRAAMALYGSELGVCGSCGRTLTDDDSRTVGIGPVCVKKRGW